MELKNEKMDYENLEIGKEQPPIEPKKVKVLSVRTEEVKNKEDKVVGDKLLIKVQHPDQPEMELSKVKYEKGKKLTESGIWINTDKDGQIPFKSALASLLRHYNAAKINDLVDKEIDTCLDDNGYLIAKAY